MWKKGTTYTCLHFCAINTTDVTICRQKENKFAYIKKKQYLCAVSAQKGMNYDFRAEGK